MIHFQRVGADAVGEWDAFLDGPTDGTLFHRLSFLSYHPEGRFRLHWLEARRDDRLIAVLPAASEEEPDGRVLGSPYGGSFGGIAAGPIGPAAHRDVLGALVTYAREGGFRRLWLSSRPAPYRIHGDGAEFALAAAGGKITAREITHVADLRGGEEAVRARIRGTSRRGARKAERLGTTVRSGDRSDLDAFWTVLAEDRARLDATPTHTAAELHDLASKRPDDFRLWVAENGGRIVGGKLVFVATPRIALGFYTARRAVDEAERCTNLLTERAMLDLAAEGFEFLDYGTSSIRGELNPGLSEFKEGFGGLPYLRETWRLDLD
ncbi:MAG: GNAT family N-acetyltransferase [bacterium]